ncbi:MAG: adenosine-specific kinase [Pseudomonadota bacterium]
MKLESVRVQKPDEINLVLGQAHFIRTVEDLHEALAITNLKEIGAGHTFLVMLGNLFPIHALRAIREVPEVCRIFCATANPVEVLVAETGQGRGVVGVVDGGAPLGVEGPQEIAERKAFLRKIGLKL